MVTMSAASDFPHMNATAVMFFVRHEVFISWRPGYNIYTQFTTVYHVTTDNVFSLLHTFRTDEDTPLTTGITISSAIPQGHAMHYLA